MTAFHKTVFVCLAAAIAALPGAVPGGESVEGAEDWTVITCDGNLFMDYGRQQAVFYNNVRVENPRGNIVSDRLTVFFTPDGRTVSRAEGEGNVRIESGGKVGRGERMIYYPEEKKTVLIGDATVTVGGDSVRGGMITFFLDTGEMEVEDRPLLEYRPEEDIRVDF